jgi:hypothetical protein
MPEVSGWWVVVAAATPVFIQVFMFDPAYRAAYFVMFLLLFGFVAALYHSRKDVTK